MEGGQGREQSEAEAGPLSLFEPSGAGARKLIDQFTRPKSPHSKGHSVSPSSPSSLLLPPTTSSTPTRCYQLASSPFIRTSEHNNLQPRAHRQHTSDSCALSPPVAILLRWQPRPSSDIPLNQHCPPIQHAPSSSRHLNTQVDSLNQSHAAILLSTARVRAQPNYGDLAVLSGAAYQYHPF
ncbi:hypothetical protein CALVIDRAFT_190050 [Calocera viscosa TUFC12733]|uniref:Uncharacterized protein n=1 Tax=Calocera viscosa (strain TUFC12733) TaxID=1330018 RepID=A0A167KM06_CALVF|nr:hypothetical protein CALVIDRAFT_190050 [Calocera viscosa TUFC12733]